MRKGRAMRKLGQAYVEILDLTLGFAAGLRRTRGPHDPSAKAGGPCVGQDGLSEAVAICAMV